MFFDSESTITIDHQLDGMVGDRDLSPSNDEPSGFEEEYAFHQHLPDEIKGSHGGLLEDGLGGVHSRNVRQRPAFMGGPMGDDDEDETVVMENGRTETYSKCQICKNKIMSTRLSNLINHVKRHAVLKQYQCPHCQYGHNEQAKVGLIL